MQLGSILLLKPSLPELEAIAEVLTACDAKIAALGRESALLDELFHALLEELMTGGCRWRGAAEDEGLLPMRGARHSRCLWQDTTWKVVTGFFAWKRSKDIPYR